jgi:hypothetical protein
VVVVVVVVLPFSSVVEISVVEVEEDEQPTAPKAKMDERPQTTMGWLMRFTMVEFPFLCASALYGTR